jgi:uncharacterized protein YprB with RNaseH-like and TPR domain
LLEAYLDIETTGLSAFSGAITVVGIYLCDDSDARFIQLVGRDITRYSLLEILEGVDTIYTYNGRRFDLPFINVHLGINLEEMFNHRDLMYDCWRYNLRGGVQSGGKTAGYIPEAYRGGRTHGGKIVVAVR